MAQRKPYNPNTKYGRRRMREQNAQYRSSLSPEEKAKHNSLEWVITIVVFGVIALVLFLIGGSDAVFKYFSN